MVKEIGPDKIIRGLTQGTKMGMGGEVRSVVVAFIRTRLCSVYYGKDKFWTVTEVSSK